MKNNEEEDDDDQSYSDDDDDNDDGNNPECKDTLRYHFDKFKLDDNDIMKLQSSTTKRVKYKNHDASTWIHHHLKNTINKINKQEEFKVRYYIFIIEVNFILTNIYKIQLFNSFCSLYQIQI